MTAVVISLGVVFAVVWFLLRGSGKKQQQNPGARVGKPVSRRTASAQLPDTQTDSVDAPPELAREIPDALRDFRLVTADQLSDEKREAVMAICAQMAEPHPVQSQLARGLDSPDELMEAVASDAGLTASILRTVNSAAFSLASPITSVQHAITYLGVSVVKSLVAQAAVAERVADGSPAQQAALARIWKSACGASAIAQALAQELSVPRPSVLATKALFFNLGDVAIVSSTEDAAAWYGDGVSILERVEQQQAHLGSNTAIVGAALARHWHLPDDLAKAIEDGLLPLSTAPGAYALKGEEHVQNVLMYLASRIGDRATYHGLEDVAELPLAADDEPAFFYLPDHLSAAGLGRVPALLEDPAFRRKANRLLTTLAG